MTEVVKDAAQNRIRLLPRLATLVALALSASNLPAGVNTWTTNGPNGASVQSLAIDPVIPSFVYAGTLSDGVFKSADPGLSYSLAPGQTQSIADLLPAMGRSGLGSRDIEITSGGVPVATARVFNDAGPSGTTGFTEEAMREDEALRPGQTGVLLIPPDFTVARFNVGIRTLEDGASVTFTLRNASGAVVGSNTRAFPPDFHEQRDAAGFLGGSEVPPGGSISITLISGAAIAYGATVDNRTGDPSLQIARATS
jgi:hypothetical protein